MTWNQYQFILNSRRYNNATGSGDASVDANPAVNPNNILAPIASGSAGHVAILILGYLLIFYVAILICKQLKLSMPTV